MTDGGGLPYKELFALLGVLLTAVGTFLASRYASRGGIEQARTSAIKEAVTIGSQLRDELRSELQGERVRRREIEQQVAEVKMALADALGQLKVVKNLRCPRSDCPVFRDAH